MIDQQINTNNNGEFRKLTTIRKVKNIIPIENADLIEIVKIDGWQCIAKKGEFKINDYCVYFEIDSFLPEISIFEFLRKSCYKEWGDGKNNYKGFRLKTIKLKGQLSQGLALPISILPEKMQNEKALNVIFEKQVNISNQLGVIKYDPVQPVNVSAKIKGQFPVFLQKTDQERTQNIWEEYKEKYNDIEFEATLKLNGTSFTAYLNNGKYGICSRNLELETGEFGMYNLISKTYNIENKLRNLNKNLSIQGEIIGDSIQGNYEKIEGNMFYVFDVYDIDLKRYLTQMERLKILNELNKDDGNPLTILLHTKIYPPIKLNQFNSLEDLLLFCEGKSINEEVEREGLVFKSTELINGAIISFKGISDKFLLNEN